MHTLHAVREGPSCCDSSGPRYCPWPSSLLRGTPGLNSKLLVGYSVSRGHHKGPPGQNSKLLIGYSAFHGQVGGCIMWEGVGVSNQTGSEGRKQGKKVCCPCPLMGVVQVGLRVPTASPWVWYSPTYRVLALPQVDLPVLAHSAWLVTWVGVTAKQQLGTLLCVCVRVHVCVCMCVDF